MAILEKEREAEEESGPTFTWPLVIQGPVDRVGHIIINYVNELHETILDLRLELEDLREELSK